VGEVERAKDLVVYCHHGTRSARAIQFLVQAGFDPARLWNLTGGIDAWSRDVDSSVPLY
jgi:rhodanese-related sulfurtransferase